MIIYLIKGITPLQKEVNKIINNKNKNVKIDNLENIIINKNINVNMDEKHNIIELDPKKENKDIVNKNLFGEKTIQKKRRVKNKKKRKTINANISNTFKNENNKINDNFKSQDIIYDNSDKVNNNVSNNNYNNLDELDFNNLNYDKAIELDKRKFIQIYWSKLKRKHLIIFTFFSQNDYNLIYIKIARFIFLICTSMATNVLFFFDSSMHKIYLDYGKYNFVQQIPQILYSSIISLIMDILISFLSNTDINIYQIKQLKEGETEQINKILKKIKIKLITFFIITFIFILFYWYLISSFCAVYNNTQIIYIKDFITSFCLGLVYPFVIQLCFTFIRIFSLKKNSNFRSLLYKFC